MCTAVVSFLKRDCDRHLYHYVHSFFVPQDQHPVLLHHPPAVQFSPYILFAKRVSLSCFCWSQMDNNSHFFHQKGVDMVLWWLRTKASLNCQNLDTWNKKQVRPQGSTEWNFCELSVQLYSFVDHSLKLSGEYRPLVQQEHNFASIWVDFQLTSPNGQVEILVKHQKYRNISHFVINIEFLPGGKCEIGIHVDFHPGKLLLGILSNRQVEVKVFTA